MTADPEFLLTLFKQVCADLAEANDQVVTVGRRQAEESLASFLLAVEARTAERSFKGDFLSLPMLHSDVADYLGLTSETVSRVFTHFKKQGLIELRGRHGIRLANRRALKEIAMRPSARHGAS